MFFCARIILMNVLSLFDGMSCGRIALERAGIQVSKYYASELDKYAIKVTQANWSETIQLGDVTKWREWDIDWSSIDLLIGGSPCQGFSFAGKQLAFDDPRSKLFFVYVDILNHIKWIRRTAGKPELKFMLENVKMKKEFLNVINEKLGVDPVFINSALVSAQNRQRYYWANWDFDQPEDKKTYGSHFDGNPIDEKRKLAHEIQAKINHGALSLVGFYKGNSTSQRVYSLEGKLPCLLTNNTGGNNPLWISLDGGKTAYSASSALQEFMQTLPLGYTNFVSENQRKRMLGNGWTVDVIAHIFRSINETHTL